MTNCSQHIPGTSTHITRSSHILHIVEHIHRIQHIHHMHIHHMQHIQHILQHIHIRSPSKRVCVLFLFSCAYLFATPSGKGLLEASVASLAPQSTLQPPLGSINPHFTIKSKGLGLPCAGRTARTPAAASASMQPHFLSSSFRISSVCRQPRFQ